MLTNFAVMCVTRSFPSPNVTFWRRETTTNQTRTHVLQKTKPNPNPKSKSVQKPKLNQVELDHVMSGLGLQLDHVTVTAGSCNVRARVTAEVCALQMVLFVMKYTGTGHTIHSGKLLVKFVGYLVF